MTQQLTSNQELRAPHAPFNLARPVLLLINARSCQGRVLRRAAITACQSAGILLSDIVMTKSYEETARLLQGEINDGAPLVIVGGGDGTLSFCAGQPVNTPMALGVLPMGTGNTFARSSGLPFDLNQAAQIIADSHITAIDVGTVNGRVFLNSVTLGLSTEIARALDARSKRRLGLLIYPIVGWHVFRRHRALLVRLHINGRSLSLRTHQLVVANGRYIAGPIAASPDSSIDDKRLDVFVLGGQSRADLLRATWKWLRGRHPHLVARSLSIEISHGVLANVDGELFEHTKLDLKVWPDALRVVVPRGLLL